MQIHELTLRKKTNEGFLDTLKGAGQQALQAFNDPQAAMAAAGPTAKANNRLQAATQGLVKKLSAEWAQISKSIPAPSQADVQARSKVKPSGTAPAAATTPTAQQAPGRRISRTRGGQMSGQLAKSKTGQQMQQMFGAPRGGIENMKSDLEEAFGDLPGAKPAAPATPQAQTAKYKAAKASAPELAARNAYRTAFTNWVNKNIATKEQSTGTPMDLTYISQDPKVKAQLDQLLTAIINNRTDPEANQKSVEAYLQTAITAMQAKAKEIRSVSGSTGGKTIKSTGNPQADKDLKALGYTVL